MPPISIRRPVTVTVWLIVSATCVLVSPLLLGIGMLVQALTGSRKPLIVARLIIAYFAHELLVLVACGALWLGSGFGRAIGSTRFQRLHWQLVRWFFGGLASAGRTALGIDVVAESSPEATRALESDQPLIVLSRHAGPGDTIFITDQLLSRYRRRPSVVFKDSLAIDPCVDLLAHRLPQAMLDRSDRDEAEARIEQVTAELGPRGALLLFPEGGNFTPKRRRSALARLRRKGRYKSAARAKHMPHLLPPQPAGTQAALRGGRGTDVVFAAHTGLGMAAYPRQLWDDMPIDRTLHTRMWLVRASDVPEDPDKQVEWLYDWWRRIEEWVAGYEGSTEAR
jgi:1-acyl-sn-glycerol-3-phosphate acyltransferase